MDVTILQATPAPLLEDIKGFFGIDAERFPFDQLYVRSGEEVPKCITYLTRTIKTQIVDKDVHHDLKVGERASERTNERSD